MLKPDTFIGSWVVQRKSVDHLARATFRFAGSAVLTATSFEEHGEFHAGHAALQASRAYSLVMSETGVAILFRDQRRFVTLELGRLSRVEHLCGGDRYDGRFFFRSSESWAELWNVSGRRKRYTSLTHYRRATG